MLSTAVVLAGGTSRRFGTDKLDAVLAGGTLLQTTLAALPAAVDVVVVGPERPTARTVRFVREDPPGGGPAAALVTGLSAALAGGADLVAVLPADAPAAGRAAAELLRRLAGKPAVSALVAVDEEGRVQPLQLALRRDAAAALVAAAVAGGQGASARRLVATLQPPAEEVRLSPETLFDIDTPAQLAVWHASRSAAVESLLTLLERIRRTDGSPVVLALDGRGGTATATLAAAVALRTPAVVVPGRDFAPEDSAAEDPGPGDFLADASSAGSAPHPPAVRSVPDEPEAAATALDWARLRAEALEPLVAGRVARYRPSDRARPTGERAGPGSGLVRTLHPAPVVVVEGVDSARPELADLVTVAVLLRAAGDRRAQRPDARGDAVALGSLGERGERHPLITVLTPADLGLVIEEEIGHEHGA